MYDKPTVVYLAHPFTGNHKQNVRRVTQIAKQIINASEKGTTSSFYAPLVPHLLLSTYSEDTNPSIRKITEALSTTLVRASDELWVVSPTISPGMKLEIETAVNAGVPVRQWTEVLGIIPKLSMKFKAS